MTRLRLAPLLLVPLLSLVGCKPKDAPPPATTNPDGTTSLADARKGFTTKLARQTKAGTAVEPPPANLFRVVQYDAPVGKCAAYLTPNPKDGKKRPAIVWITGGDSSTIDAGSWKEGSAASDQSAAAYRKAGLVMMFPSLRGGNQNPGLQENFYGEGDDVLAAAEYLAKQDYVDPARIYLGGHSTGGTLVMLVAAVPNRFRAVFSFGPADSVVHYPDEYNGAVNLADAREVELRSPGRWLHSIQCPTFVFEGTREGNLNSLQTMAQSSSNPKAHFYPVRGATHFSVLAPVNRLIAKRIAADAGAETNLTFTEAELNALFGG